MFAFWRIIFKKLDIELLTSTVYHSQTNDQFERTNQILKIVLRFWLSNSKNKNWIEALSYLTIFNNNSINVSIDFALNELSYEFRVNDTLSLFENLFAKNYNRLRQIKRKFVEKVMTFVNVMHKLRYDVNHVVVNIKIKNKVFLRLHVDYIIFDLINEKLSQQRVEFFKILVKVDILAYKLELSFIMQIHSVISIAQLKLASKDANLYNCFKSSNSQSITTKKDDDFDDSNKTYEIEALLNRRIIFTDRVKYLVKWKNVESEHNVWYSLHALDSVVDLVNVYDVRYSRFVRRLKIQKSRSSQTIATQRSNTTTSSAVTTSSAITTSSTSQATIAITRRFICLLKTSLEWVK